MSWQGGAWQQGGSISHHNSRCQSKADEHIGILGAVIKAKLQSENILLDSRMLACTCYRCSA